MPAPWHGSTSHLAKKLRRSLAQKGWLAGVWKGAKAKKKPANGKKKRKNPGEVAGTNVGEGEGNETPWKTTPRTYPCLRSSPRHFPPLLWFMRAMRVATGYYTGFRLRYPEGSRWMGRDRPQRDYRGSSTRRSIPNTSHTVNPFQTLYFSDFHGLPTSYLVYSSFSPEYVQGIRCLKDDVSSRWAEQTDHSLDNHLEELLHTLIGCKCIS